MIEVESPSAFLADSHLPLIETPFRQIWMARVIDFLRTKAATAKSLFLVGDVFDFWFEWKHCFPSRSFKILAEIYKLIENGTQVYYVAGNHDGHLGKFLSDEVGINVTRAHFDVTSDNKKLFIIHGDGVAVADRGYRMLRTIVRWKFTETIYRKIHPDFGIWFASKMSNVSNYSSGSYDKFGVDPYREYAKGKLDEGYNYVVMGHRHYSEFVEHKNGGYAAVGDWIRNGSYGWFENGIMQVKYFK